MANFFTGLGQALPQAVGLMTNIQELQERSRHTREMEGMEQEKMGMMRHNYNIENRLRETQIRENELKTQAMEDDMKPYSVDNFMRTIQAPDRVKKMMADKAAIFIKTSPSGERFVRKGDLKNIQQMLADPTFQLQINSATVQETRKELNALYAELNDKPNDKKITERVQQLEQMNQDALIAEDSLQRQLGIKEKAKSDMNISEAEILSLPQNDPRRIAYIEGKQALAKPEKLPSLGNAAETAIVMKFGSRDYLTDPKKSAQADAWIGTKEGQEYLARATSLLTPPSVSFQQTAEGITPGITRGPGAGTLGTPTGVGKPVPPGEVTKIGDLNTLARNISEAEKLYNPEWVGPVMGRVGGVREKYTGGASEEQVKFYAYVRDMKDALLRARSGAQINEQEYARLVKFLPDENSPAKTFEARLARFKEAVGIILEEKKRSLSEGGYGKSVGKTKKPLSAFEGR